MTYLAFGLLAVVLVLLEVKDRRITNERARWDEAFAGLFTALHTERQAHPDLTELTRLVENLCQRIQAPTAAVMEHHDRAIVMPPDPPGFGLDDEEFESKEDLADRLAAEEGLSVGAA